MLGHSPLRAAATLPFTRCRYCRVARLRIDVHDNDIDNNNNNDNDNA